ncbi:membrane integrity-associated transporter subunit PqiC [Pyxidicoccus parkwayensis]|uniref:Membrane integrity-associated transporter subunit PqiC n=1 Tax=Pyxidicoccus parkwayensis TaxID=2813578 RepID=A0ABX7P5Z8_9BACT|nr:ABC-type transport auxiliary lipoprotein family protein [Pyxidicoccus parkwaysis]QSQ25894.1 membrane integrity-associated transporter subunit PqiC [Pyxidicoccus parkwaysis]
MNRMWLVAFLPAAVAAGCALTSKGKLLEVSWYTLELIQPGTANPQSAGPVLRLGYVHSGADLGQRIAWGDGAYRMGFYEERRWTERPAQFVTTALHRALFEAHAFRRASQVTAPQLDIEVVSLQELRSPRAHAGRVALHVRLSGERELLDTTIVRDEPVRGGRFEDVVAAISHALDDATNEVAERVEAALCASPGVDGVTGASCHPSSP